MVYYIIFHLPNFQLKRQFDILQIVKQNNRVALVSGYPFKRLNRMRKNKVSQGTTASATCYNHELTLNHYNVEKGSKKRINRLI